MRLNQIILNRGISEYIYYPMMHNVDVHKMENVPLVVINFSTDSV